MIQASSDTVFTGAKTLLRDVTHILRATGISDYMIIGGWCPYLRNDKYKTGLTHPGTLDVDILFREADSSGTLSAFILAMLDAGFCASAKHSFQLLRRQQVGGTTLIYNVDLLHPGMLADKTKIAIDHLDLDLYCDDALQRAKHVTSIVLPSSALLFDYAMFDTFTYEDLSFPLIDFTGMFITKLESCLSKKESATPLISILLC